MLSNYTLAIYSLCNDPFFLKQVHLNLNNLSVNHICPPFPICTAFRDHVFSIPKLPLLYLIRESQSLPLPVFENTQQMHLYFMQPDDYLSPLYLTNSLFCCHTVSLSYFVIL